jgi:hypothetical protein
MKQGMKLIFKDYVEKKMFAKNLHIHKKITLTYIKKFSHYIINPPCLNNCDQCKNPEQIQQ